MKLESWYFLTVLPMFLFYLFVCLFGFLLCFYWWKDLVLAFEEKVENVS